MKRGLRRLFRKKKEEDLSVLYSSLSFPLFLVPRLLHPSFLQTPIFTLNIHTQRVTMREELKKEYMQFEIPSSSHHSSHQFFRTSSFLPPSYSPTIRWENLLSLLVQTHHHSILPSTPHSPLFTLLTLCFGCKKLSSPSSSLNSRPEVVKFAAVHDLLHFVQVYRAA